MVWNRLAGLQMVALGCIAAVLAWSLPAPVAIAADDDASHAGADTDHAAHDDAEHDDDGHADAAHAAEHASHGDDAHGASAGPLTWQTDAAIWTVVVFLLLFAVLYKYAWKPLGDALERREQAIADNIAAAKASNEEAKRHLAEYERKLAAAQDEVRAILDEARRDAEQTQREMLTKAGQEAEVIKNRATREIETATAAALKELADHSSRLAVDLAGRILHAELDPQRHNQLIEEALNKFPTNSQN